MPLYGNISNTGSGETLGGSPNTPQPLSQRNQVMAQQLNLPGHGAGSQQEAQSDWANFEDVFNKNQGYIQREKDAAEAATRYSGLKAPTTTTNAPNANQAQKGAQAPAQAALAPTVTSTPAVANPSAPAQMQAPTLAGIQQKSDFLSGFGQSAPQAYGGSGVTTLGQGQTRTSRADQPVSYAQADEGIPSKGLAPPVDVAQKNPVLPDMSKVALPPASGEMPAGKVAPAPAPAPNAKVAAPPAGAGQALNNKPTQAETDEHNRLSDVNDVLKGWGDDNGLDVLQKAYGPEATQYDADLMATGGGRTLQQNLSKEYGAKQESFDKGVYDRIGKANALQKQLGANQRQNARLGATTPATGGVSGSGAPGQSDFDKLAGYGEGSTADDHALMNNLLFGNNDENPWSNMHAMGMSLNPADWATIAMGEAGVDVPVTTEIFGQMGPWGAAAQASGMADTWNEGRFIMAFNELVNNGTSQISPQARHAFLMFLKDNPAVLQEYLAMKNPGFMARNMRQWMSTWDQAHLGQNQTQNIQNAAQGGAGNLAATMQSEALKAGAKPSQPRQNGLGFSF